jgi:hypothetical protein
MEYRAIGDLLGPWARYTVIVVISFALFGVCVAQIVASAADAYYITESIDKRCERKAPSTSFTIFKCRNRQEVQDEGAVFMVECIDKRMGFWLKRGGGGDHKRS